MALKDFLLSQFTSQYGRQCLVWQVFLPHDYRSKFHGQHSRAIAGSNLSCCCLAPTIYPCCAHNPTPGRLTVVTLKSARLPPHTIHFPSAKMLQSLKLRLQSADKGSSLEMHTLHCSMTECGCTAGCCCPDTISCPYSPCCLLQPDSERLLGGHIHPRHTKAGECESGMA